VTDLRPNALRLETSGFRFCTVPSSPCLAVTPTFRVACLLSARRLAPQTCLSVSVEKGGKRHEMPVHHTLEEYLDRYIEAAGIKGEPKSPLFRASNGKSWS